MSEHLDHIARVYDEKYWRLFASLDTSLDPRGPDLLFDIAGAYLTPESRVLDAGCRDAAHLIRLVENHDVSGVGVDPVQWHIDRANTAVDAAGLRGRIEIRKGALQDLPFPDKYFGLIWCRDVVPLVDDLQAAMTEAARVLQAGGHMVVYTNLTTELLEANEAEMINTPMGNVVESMKRTTVEDAFMSAGLDIERTDLIGTEWCEYDEERTQSTSRALLRLARLRRQRDEIVAEHGEDVFSTAQASLQWATYQFLGKVEPVVYILVKD